MGYYQVKVIEERCFVLSAESMGAAISKARDLAKSEGTSKKWTDNASVISKALTSAEYLNMLCGK